jgi:hypothetical protein
MSKKNLYIILGLLFFCLIVVFKDFVLVGFTNSDDSTNYISSLIGGVFTDCEVWAEGQGRFFFYFRVPWSKIPYLFDNIYWLKTLQYLPVVLGFFLFSIILSKYLKSVEFGIILFSFLLCVFPLPSAVYQPPTAYPFLFTTDLVIFLLSLLCFLQYKKTKIYSYYILFIILFTIPLFSYESYLLFHLALLTFLYLKRLKQQEKSWYKTIFWDKEITPFISIGIFFLIVYFGYRYSINYSSKSGYSGNTITSKFEISNLLKLIHNFNSSAFPMHTYFKNKDVFKSLDNNYKNNFLYIIKSLTVIELLKSIIVTSIVVFYLSKIKKSFLDGKRFLFIFLGAIFISYAQNILFGLTEKYNQDVYTIDGYVTTYFSFYGINLAIIILFIFCFSRINNSLFKKIYLVTIGVIIYTISLLTTYSNKMISKDLQITKHKFEVVDEIIKNKTIKSFSKNGTLMLEKLNETESIVGNSVCYGHFNWIGYIYGKSKKEIKYFSEKKSIKDVLSEKLTDSIGIIKQIKNKNKKQVTLIFSKLKTDSLENNELLSNNLIIYLFDSSETIKNYKLKINGLNHTFTTKNIVDHKPNHKYHYLSKINSGIYISEIKNSIFNISTIVND